MTKSRTGDPAIDALYDGRRGRVDFVDVPEFGYVMVDGEGSPEGGGFGEAIQALYSVSFGAHFALKKATGTAPAVMALEALWWSDGTGNGDSTSTSTGTGTGSVLDVTDRDHWCWRAMILQLAPIDEALVAQAVAEALRKGGSPALSRLRYERWREGECAQIMHVGPYATEATTIAALHTAIDEHGARLRGMHHEIYLGDPRRSAPEKLRTLIRQPIAR